MGKTQEVAMLEATPDFEWSEYFAQEQSGRKHPIFEHLTPHLKPGQVALDLGCGVGHGTEYLDDLGLEVTALDASPEALESVRNRLPKESSTILIQCDFMSASFPPASVDMIIATNALYFLSHAEFGVFWPRLVSWLKPGGIFAGQFMGPNDAWAFRKDYGCQTLETINSLFEGFELLHLHEDERDSENIPGKPSHVHIFHVMARKGSILGL